MKSNLEKRAVKRIREHVELVCKRKVLGIRHVYPRCHVIGYAAPLCLVVHAPWQDAEPHLQEWQHEYPLKTVNEFEEGIFPGDCVAVAYVNTPGRGERYAVKMRD